MRRLGVGHMLTARKLSVEQPWTTAEVHEKQQILEFPWLQDQPGWRSRTGREGKQSARFIWDQVASLNVDNCQEVELGKAVGKYSFSEELPY